MPSESTPECRVYAELPSGAYMVPGQSSECPGPDAFGLCPIEATDERPCANATWHYAGPRGWTFHFDENASLCPVTVLDPLGPLSVPLD